MSHIEALKKLRRALRRLGFLYDMLVKSGPVAAVTHATADTPGIRMREEVGRAFDEFRDARDDVVRSGRPAAPHWFAFDPSPHFILAGHGDSATIAVKPLDLATIGRAIGEIGLEISKLQNGPADARDPISLIDLRSIVPQKTVKGPPYNLKKYLERRGRDCKTFLIADKLNCERQDAARVFPELRARILAHTGAYI